MGRGGCADRRMLEGLLFVWRVFFFMNRRTDWLFEGDATGARERLCVWMCVPFKVGFVRLSDSKRLTGVRSALALFSSRSFDGINGVINQKH